MWFRTGPGKHVHNVPAIFRIMITGHRLQASYLVEVIEVILKEGFHIFLIDLIFLQRVLEFFEYRRLIIPQLRLYPVFGVKEDLTVGLPDTVPFTPGLPLGTGTFRYRDQHIAGNRIFQLKQYPVYEQLH